MSEIKLYESFGTFVYFFLFTCILAIIGAQVPGMTKDIGDVMQEHIAGKTILASCGVTLFLGYFCALRNIANPQRYGKYISYLIIKPSNFVITLAFVAAAINWGVALSSYFLFPLVVTSDVFAVLVQSALQISVIALGMAFVAWCLHLSPADSKTNHPFDTPLKSLFWIVFGVSSIFWLALFATIVTWAIEQ